MLKILVNRSGKIFSIEGCKRVGERTIGRKEDREKWRKEDREKWRKEDREKGR